MIRFVIWKYGCDSIIRKIALAGGGIGEKLSVLIQVIFDEGFREEDGLERCEKLPFDLVTSWLEVAEN
jgi:hypothetical protein